MNVLYCAMPLLTPFKHNKMKSDMLITDKLCTVRSLSLAGGQGSCQCDAN